MVNQATFDFTSDLPHDVCEYPNPDGREGTLHLLVDPVLNELFLFLSLVLVSEDEEEDSERYHDGGNDEFCDF